MSILQSLINSKEFTMVRFNTSLVLILLGSLMFTACSTPQVSDSNSQSNPVASETTNAATASDPKSDLNSLQKVVLDTTNAVDAKNFDQAKEEFEHFEEYWSKIEDGVKDKSADTYKQVEDAADTVSVGLKVSSPDQAKLLDALRSLSTTLEQYTNSL
jgi:hypothetical protein